MRKLGFRPVRRIVRDESGATAVEFSFVALPFFMLLFAIIETSLVFYASQIMETAVADTGRLIMTGQAQGAMGITTRDQFKTELCRRITAIIDCLGGVSIDVQNYDFGTPVPPQDPTIADGSVDNSTFAFSPGSAGSIVIVRAMYAWPVTVNFLGLGNLSGGKRLLVATSTFRNEPF